MTMRSQAIAIGIAGYGAIAVLISFAGCTKNDAIGGGSAGNSGGGNSGAGGVTMGSGGSTGGRSGGLGGSGGSSGLGGSGGMAAGTGGAAGMEGTGGKEGGGGAGGGGEGMPTMPAIACPASPQGMACDPPTGTPSHCVATVGATDPVCFCPNAPGSWICPGLPYGDGGMTITDCAAGINDGDNCTTPGVACTNRGPNGKVASVCLCDGQDNTWTCE